MELNEIPSTSANSSASAGSLCAQILNKLFGYEPYPGFCKNVDRKMEADLRENRVEQRKIT